MRFFVGQTKELSIPSRLLLWFLAIAMIPCGILTAVLWTVSARSLEATIKRSLLVIAENRTDAIEALVRERRGDVRVAGHLPFVVSAVESIGKLLETSTMETEEYRKLADPLSKTFEHFRSSYGYRNVYLFDVKGNVLYRMVNDINIGKNLLDGPLKDSELADSFERASTLLQGVFSDYQIYPESKDPLCFVTHPVFDGDGIFVGIVSFQLGNETIYRILSDYNGLGETGDIEVATLREQTVTYVAPVRSDPNAAFERTVKLGEPNGDAIQKAVTGKRGFGDSVDYRGERVVSVWSYIPSLRWGIVVKQDMSEAYRMIDQLRYAVVGLLIVTTVVVVIVALQVAKTLSRPIQDAAEVADRVASGDLTAKLQTNAKGEEGQLLRAIAKMTADLRALIGKIQKSSIALMSTATEIAATSRQQEQTVNEYGTSTNEAAAAVKEISATGKELLKTMTEVNQVANSTASMASVGQESLASMDKTMRLLADSTASIGTKLSVISERAATINLVVTTITKVADQTNLLSINAAIEAEKAGEYGLGFLVVAREIRRLADQTAVSTLDIERMVKEMQYSVSAGVMEMDKFSDQVRQGVSEVALLGDQLGSIITAVRGLTEQFDSVTEGVRVQSQGADQIREAVIRLSDGANLTLVSLREFNQATGHLREAIGGLKDEVSRFKVEDSRMA